MLFEIVRVQQKAVRSRLLTSQCGFSDSSDNLAGFGDWPGWSPGISYTSGTVGVGGTFCDPLENLERPDIYFSLDERELLFDAIAPT